MKRGHCCPTMAAEPYGAVIAGTALMRACDLGKSHQTYPRLLGLLYTYRVCINTSPPYPRLNHSLVSFCRDVVSPPHRS